jgi:hypothetical protein
MAATEELRLGYEEMARSWLLLAGQWDDLEKKQC